MIRKQLNHQTTANTARAMGKSSSPSSSANNQFHNRLYLITLLASLIIGSVLRLYRLNQLPPGLYWDEVSIGYNAYSLLLTGKDEHGESYPIWFKAYGDYKYPLYIYATIPFIKLLGLTETAIRLPSALSGILSIAVIFLLVKELLKSRPYALDIAAISSFFFAISPWSIQFSRAGFEANLALLSLLIAIWLTFLGFNTKKTTIFILAGISYFLCPFAYQSTRMFLPLFIVCLIIIYHAEIKTSITAIVRSLIITVIICSPFITAQIDTKSLFRASTVTYINLHQPELTLKRFQTEYLSHFDTNYLFFYGDQTGRHSVRYLGMMHYYDLPLVIMGLYFLFTFIPAKPRWLIISWLLLAPLPAALAQPNPHALRSLNILPAWIIISALGLYFLLSQIKNLFATKPYFYKLAYCLTVLVITYNFLIYLNEYYIRYPKATALDWSNGFKETIDLVKSQADNFDQIYISDSIPLPYLGYYLPIPPQTYQPIADKFVTGKWPKFDNFSFFNLAWKLPTDKQHSRLIVAPSWQKPGSETPYQTVKLINGDDLFNIWSENASH